MCARAGKIAAVVMLAATLPCERLRAQVPDTPVTIPDDRLFTKSDLLLLAGFTGATIAMFPLDRQIASNLRDSSLIQNRGIRDAAKVFGFLGSPGSFIIGGTLYVIGRAADKPRLAHLAVHGGEAIAVGLAVTGVLKTALGRSRPFVSADTNPRDFDLLRGFRGDRYQAFPSGHTTTIFAAASALTAELREWYPRSTWIAGPVLYGGAILVGASRMYEDKHWASDVVLGAAIGTFAGLKTVRFTHTRTGNRVDRWLLGDGAPLQLDVTPTVDGARFTARKRW